MTADRVRKVCTRSSCDRTNQTTMAEAPSPCFYRLRGHMIVTIRTTELVVPLQCRCTTDAQHIVCQKCQRSFHTLCDEGVAVELGLEDYESTEKSTCLKGFEQEIHPIDCHEKGTSSYCGDQVCLPCRQSLPIVYVLIAKRHSALLKHGIWLFTFVFRISREDSTLRQVPGLHRFYLDHEGVLRSRLVHSGIRTVRQLS